MSLSYKQVRGFYYTGIALLVLNALPAARTYLSFVFDFQIFNGISVITIVAVLTGIGAFMAYNRKLG